MIEPNSAGDFLIRNILFGIFISGFFLLSALALWDPGLAGIASNSDLVQPYLVTGDLLANPGAFYSWKHSPSPYVFPDMLIAVVLVLLPLSPKWMTIFYAGALLAGYVLAGGWIVSRATKAGYMPSILVFAICLVSVLFAARWLPGTQLSNWLLLTLLLPFIHTGALLSTLIAICLLERVMRQPPSMWVNMWLIVLVAVSSFSDVLFVAWFVLPSLLVLQLKAKVEHCRPPKAMMATLFCVALVSFVFERLVHGAGKGMTLKPESIANSASAFTESLMGAVSKPDWMLIFLLVIAFAICVAGLKALQQAFRSAQMNFLSALDIMLSAMIVMALAAPIFTSYFQEDAHWRYMILIPFVAVLRLTITLASIMAARQFTITLPAVVAVAFVAAMGPGAYGAVSTPAKWGKLAQCLVAEGFSTGLSNYWLAKHLIFQSQRALHLVQIGPHGTRFDYNYNRDWYQHRVDDQSPIRPNFIIMSGLEADSIEQRFGPPKDTAECNGHAIWLYDRLSVP